MKTVDNEKKQEEAGIPNIFIQVPFYHITNI